MQRNAAGLRALIFAHPEALHVADCVTGLPPFIFAASNNDVVDGTYELLLAAPKMLNSTSIGRHSDADVSSTTAGKTSDNAWTLCSVGVNHTRARTVVSLQTCNRAQQPPNQAGV